MIISPQNQTGKNDRIIFFKENEACFILYFACDIISWQLHTFPTVRKIFVNYINIIILIVCIHHSSICSTALILLLFFIIATTVKTILK